MSQIYLFKDGAKERKKNALKRENIIIEAMKVLVQR
jgi:hypothetical protein